MEEIRLTSRYGKYPILYRVLYIPGGAGLLPSTVSKRYTLPWKFTYAMKLDGCKMKFPIQKPKQTMGMVYLSTFTIKISHSCGQIYLIWEMVPFQGRRSWNFRGPVPRIMLAPDNLRSRLWPRSFPRHHRSIPLPVNRGLEGVQFQFGISRGFSTNWYQLYTFHFGANLQIWGVNFFGGGLRILWWSISGMPFVILWMSRNTADQFIGLAWTCPQKSRSVMVVWRFYSNILSSLLFIIF